MFDYFHIEEAETFSFIRIPKMMMTDGDFAPLSNTAKILYGLLLDRVGEAAQKDWIDDEGYVYIVYPLKEIQDNLGISRKTASDCLNELEEFGLVEKRTRGGGQPSILYVKNFAPAAV